MTNVVSQESETIANTPQSVTSNPTEAVIGHLKKELPEIEFNILNVLYSMTKEDLVKGVELNRIDICNILNRTEKSITRATKSLCQKGLIQVETARRNDGKRINIYRMNMPKIKEQKLK